MLGVRIRVFIVADVCLYREGLSRILSGRPNIDIVGTAAGAAKAVAELRMLEPKPDFVLVDLSEAHGISDIRRILRVLPGVRIVALTVHEAEDDVLACVEAGAVGYVLRDAGPEDLVGAIKRAADGEALCSPAITAALFHRVSVLASRANGSREAGGRGAALTAREVEVVELIERGLTNKEIASTLQVEIPTVKNHVHRILEKLGVRRRAQAADWVRATSACQRPRPRAA
jgi:DNA-binding NarL/FixJ family response regulator